MAEARATFAKARKGIRFPVKGSHVLTVTPHAVHRLEFQDAFFRTASATVLPEGETPVASPGAKPEAGASAPAGRAAITSVGAFATLLRFNEEHPELRILVAGHTDTEGGASENKALSLDRAKAVHALLMGEREAFAAAADKRHKVADYKQILKWASVALAEMDSFSACDPGEIDDKEFTGIEPLKAFQRAYNANKEALGAGAADLAVDGSMGPKTWGAVFDCYEFALREELGEDVPAMSELRAKLSFLVPGKPFIGFGESHPAEGAGKDNLRALANRRVEVLFFEKEDTPDLDVLGNRPEETEIYDPAVFDRILIPALGTAKRTRVEIRLESRDGHRIPDVPFTAVLADGTERKGRTGRQGTAFFKAPPDAAFTVEYQGLDDIRTKALAARLTKALDAGDHQAITGTLAVTQEDFAAMRAAIDAFFPRSGDLIGEIRAKTKGTGSESAAGYFLAGLGFPATDGQGPGEQIAFDESKLGQDGETALA